MFHSLFLVMEILFNMLLKIIFSMIVALGFAVLFNTPRRALWSVAVLGGLGFGLKSFLLRFVLPEQVVLASLAGASLVGMLGVYFAHRVHCPPIVFTIPAIINMIPGKFGYEFIIGLLTIVSAKKPDGITFEFVHSVFTNGLKAGFILMALALGVIFPILFFNTKTVKDKDLNKVIKEKVVRRVKIINYVKRKKHQARR